MLIVICWRKYKKIPSSIVLLVTLIGCSLLVPKYIVIKEYRICSVKENYQLAKNIYGEKVILYQTDFNYGDIIAVSKIKEITTKKNFLVSSFQDYLSQARVKGEAVEFSQLKKSRSFVTTLLDYIKKLPEKNREYVQTYLIQYKNETSWNSLFISSGLAFKGLINWFISCVGLVIQDNYKKWLKIYCYIMLHSCLPFMTAILIYLMYELIKLVSKETLHRVVILGICLFLFDYSLLIHPAFVFLALLNLGGWLQLTKTYFKKMFYLIICQWLTFSSFNILRSFGFSFIRNIVTITVGFSALMLFLPWQIFAFWWDILMLFDSILSVFEVYTSPNLIFCIIIMILLTIDNIQVNKLRFPIVLLIPFQQFLNPFTTVTFLDVGQADCALIASPFHLNNYLIDAGENYYPNTAINIIIPYIKKNGILWVDGIVTSHNDLDHIGAVKEIIHTIPVSKIIYQQQNVLGYNHQLLTLNHDVAKMANDNSESLISLWSSNNLRVAFLADIEQDQERDLINNFDLKRFNILKIAHHGSKSSTGEELLHSGNWKLAIFSSGKDNRYHHPNIEVIKRLEDYGIRYFNTATDGAIRVISFMGLNFVQTARGKFAIIFR